MKPLFIIRSAIPIPEPYKIPFFIVFGVLLLIISLNYEKIKKWITRGKTNTGKTTNNNNNNNNMPPEDDKKGKV